MVRLSRRAAGVRRLHVVREDALPGMRDAVGRHLALRRVPRREARRDQTTVARRRLDRRDRRVAPLSFPQREIHGVVGRGARGTPLIRAPLSTTAVLDEAADSVRLAAAPWAGVLIVTSLPYRFAQAIFVDRLLDLGGDAAHYLNYLSMVATFTMIAFVVSRWGRLVFARAIRIAAESGEAPRRDALRVSPAVFLNYLYISSFTEFLSVMTMIVCIAPALVTMLSGIAIGSAELNDHPSIAAPFRRISRYGRELKTSAALMLIFG